MVTSRIRPLAAALIAVSVAACETTSGPEAADGFDAQAALEDHRAMESVLGSSGWTTFQALVERGSFGELGAAPSSSVGVLEAAGAYARSGEASAFTVELARIVADAEGVAFAQIISGWHRGVTFVYSPLFERYMADPSREGAPATGVRFILYDESSGSIDPEAEIGWVDLIDEGDGSPEDVALRLVSVQNGLEVLNYRTTLDEVDSETGVITVAGFLQDETDRFDFDIVVRGQGGEAGTVDIGFDMGIAARDFAIVGSVTGTEAEDGSGQVDVTVRHGDESIRVDLDATSTELTGSFLIDGELFATASGHPDDPVFTSADGDPLTTYETGVLLQIVGIMEGVFELFAGLVAPVAGLVVLAVLL